MRELPRGCCRVSNKAVARNVAATARRRAAFHEGKIGTGMLVLSQ